MLSAWDACYECDAIIQEAARGDLQNPNDTLGTVGGAAASLGYLALLPPWVLLTPAMPVLGVLALLGGLTAMAVQRRRTSRYREAIVAGALPLPGRGRWLPSGT